MGAGQRLSQQAGGVEQRAQTDGVRTPGQQVEPQLRDDPVLTTQWHHVGHRTERSHLDEPRQPACTVGSLAQRLHELEGDADTGEVLVRVWTIGTLWVDDREGRRQRGVRLVMVRHHQVETQLACPSGGRQTPDAAVHRHHHGYLPRRETFDRGRFEPVSVLDPVRNEMHDVRSEQLEQAPDDDGRRHPVDVVVAMHGNALPAVDGAQQSVDRQRKIHQLEGVVEMVERRMEKPLRLIGDRNPPDHQETRYDRVDPQRGRQGGCLRLVAGEVLPDDVVSRGSGVHIGRA